MNNAVYVLGTDEYVVWEIECTSLGFTYASADWDAIATMVLRGAAFVDAPASFTAVVLSTVGTKHYGKAKLDDLGGTVPGVYRILTRLTKKVGGVEIPLIKASGTVLVEDG